MEKNVGFWKKVEIMKSNFTQLKSVFRQVCKLQTLKDTFNSIANYILVIKGAA